MSLLRRLTAFMPKYVPEFQTALDGVLAIDPTLASIVDEHDFPTFLDPRPTEQSSFEYLARSVISQQVSGAAAAAIRRRFLELCVTRSETDEGFPTPGTVMKFNIEELRSAGLSLRKAEYVRDLAKAYLDNEVSDAMFQSLDDDDVVDKIVAIRGLGPWSAQMFLIFYLHRMDVFSPADVGVQRGMRRYLKDRPHLHRDSVDATPPPSPGKSRKARAKISLPPDLVHMEKVAHRFSPYRTAFQMLLWKISDIQMETVAVQDAEVKQARAESLKREEKRRKISEPTKYEAIADELRDEAKVSGTEAEDVDESSPETRSRKTKTPTAEPRLTRTEQAERDTGTRRKANKASKASLAKNSSVEEMDANSNAVGVANGQQNE